MENTQRNVSAMAQNLVPLESAITVYYSSTTSDPFFISKPAPQLPTLTISEMKSKWLRDLRAALATSQEKINEELTLRMEEEAHRQSSNGTTLSSAEEENYGEDVGEEED